MTTNNDAQTARLLADLNRLDDRLARAQREISSGYRVSSPSDAPQDVVDILQLQADVGRAEAIGHSLGRAQAEVNTAEASLQVATQLLERARTIAAQNGTSTATHRTETAAEIRAIHRQLVEITRTLSSGRYVFSGDSDQTALYDVDLNQTAGVVRHGSPANTRAVQDVNGTAFRVSLTAGDIFDSRDALDVPDSNNVFNAVYQLGNALEHDNLDEVLDAGALISSALDHLGLQLAFYGNSQNRIANAIRLASKEGLQRTAELSGLQESDLTQAIVELSTAKMHREAALGAHSQQPQTSLFDYLG